MIMVSRLLDPDSESFDFHVLLLYITLNMQIQDWYNIMGVDGVEVAAFSLEEATVPLQPCCWSVE